MRIFKLFCILFAAFTIGAFSSCSEDIDTSNRYTFVGETMGDFLLNREDRFSSMIKIFEQAKMMGLLSTYGQHTLFLPEDTADHLSSRTVRALRLYTQRPQCRDCLDRYHLALPRGSFRLYGSGYRKHSPCALCLRNGGHARGCARYT